MRAVPVGYGRVKTPRALREWQDKVRLCAQMARIQQVVGPVELLVVAYLSMNPIDGPDWDNIVKGIQDALNGIAWHDDRQVIRGVGVKERDPANPRTEVCIRSHTPSTQTSEPKLVFAPKKRKLLPSYIPPPSHEP